MEIIPAIDIIDGKCVRLTAGDFAQKTTYMSSPLEAARAYEAAGFRRLHIVDLDGARLGKVRNLAVLEAISSCIKLDVDFGGGIRTDEDIQSVFDAGAAIVNLGSIAVHDPERVVSWIGRYGSESVLLAADVRDGKISAFGWQQKTDFELLSFLGNWHDLGINQAFVTDVSRDGLMGGPNTELYKTIIQNVPGLRLIASGGVSSLDDLKLLRDAGCNAAIVGKAIYEGKLTLDELINFQNAR